MIGYNPKWFLHVSVQDCLVTAGELVATVDRFALSIHPIYCVLKQCQTVRVQEKLKKEQQEFEF